MPTNLNVHEQKSGIWDKKRRRFYLIDDDNKEFGLFILGNPDFFKINNKRYYGGNPGGNKPSDSRWSFGYSKERFDSGLIALVKVSTDHPELFSYFPKSSFQKSEVGAPRTMGCRGNFIVQNGKIELLYQMFGCLAFADEKEAPPESLIIYQ